MRRQVVSAMILAIITLIPLALDSPAAAQQASDVKVGPGVTSSTITLGALTVLTGAYAPAAIQQLLAMQLYWEQQNANGGVCSRKVELRAQDQAYDPQKAVSLYTGMKDSVAGLQVSFGSPTTAALLDMLVQDKMLAIASSYAPSLVKKSRWVIIAGTPYDIETINAIDYMVRKAGLKKGDKLGLVYVQGEFGEGTLLGGKAAAKAYDLNLVPQEIDGNATDMSPTLATLRSQGVHHVFLAASSPQLVSLAALTYASRYNMTIGMTDSLAPGALRTSAKDALERTVILTSNTAPYGPPESPKTAAVRKAYEAKYPQEQPTMYITLGSVMADVWYRILSKACENRDLTREGLATAFRGLGKIHYAGDQVSLDFSTPGKPTSTETHVKRPDASAPGGAVLLQDAFASRAAIDYGNAAYK